MAAAGLCGPSCSAAEGCLAGDDGVCVPPTACPRLHYSCDDPSLEMRRVRGSRDRPAGLDALAAHGDVLIGNSRITAVIDALDARHYLAPSGGALLDFVPRGTSSGDQINLVFQAVGILPDDAVAYHAMELRDRRPDYVAVVLRGRLAGRPDVDVVTRYEVRPCEPGIRLRTDLYHGGRDPLAVFLSDAYFWGDREATPFVPLAGEGFVHPELDLETITQAFRVFPVVAAQSHVEPGAAYAAVPCDRDSFEGFNDVTLSAAGVPRQILLPGDAIAFERFLVTAPTPGLERAMSAALEARALLKGELHVDVSGRTVFSDGSPAGGDERIVSLHFYERGGAGTPVTEVVPNADGRFSVSLPAQRAFRIERRVLGRALPDATDFATAGTDSSIPDVVVPRTGTIHASVVDENGAPTLAEVVLRPAGATNAEGVTGSTDGVFRVDQCVPYLGPPHGASPACNRVIVNGSTSFAAPAGTFHAYGTRGPFAGLAHERIDVREGQTTEVTLRVPKLSGIVPDGALSADFHVHAGASFDSSFPERERALTFVATGVDVVAATDHNVITSYQSLLDELGIADRVHVMPGIETTSHILFYRPPGADVPKAIGHFNFWPLRYSPDAPRNGAPDDQGVEPGTLFERMRRVFSGRGVAQLNHPFGDSSFGRDTGYLTAVGWNPGKRIPAAPDGTPEGELARRPTGGLSNLDHDVQEVMTGKRVEEFLRYRAAWHSLLNQGIVRGGTANSDTHGLGTDLLGYPRNIVLGGHSLATFDEDAFNADVRKGHMVGTNGPVLQVCLPGADSRCHEPSTEPFQPAANAAVSVEVRASPWVAVDEIRFVVDGKVVKVIGKDALSHPSDAFGSAGIVRFQGSVSLRDLGLPAPQSKDAWLVVEAGMPLPLAADLDGDGLVDTTDNNHDGRVDGRDEAGKFQEPPAPIEGEPGFDAYAAAPGILPTAFTNPLFLDFDGKGWSAPGLP